MKLSDAIALGRTLIARPIAHHFYDADGPCACARGMACLAVGRESEAGITDKYDIWPWLTQEVENPCRCAAYPSKSHWAYTVINHLMFHVVGEKDDKPFPQTWTLDQLIDWVRSVEPPEPSAAPESELAFERIETDFHDSRANTR